MKRAGKLIFLVGICVLLAVGITTTMAQMRKPKQLKIIASSAMMADAATAKPKRLNQAIELLAKGQPIYYTGSHSGTNGTYEQGGKDAQTYADYISYAMEHAP